jgi:CubicO group peptidase (beta-lactamase class C family)
MQELSEALPVKLPAMRHVALSAIALAVACEPKAPAAPPVTPPAASAVASCEAPPRTPRALTDKQIEALRALATKQPSTGFTVLDGGDVVLEVGDPAKSVHVMSITKSVIGLLFGLLIEDKKLTLEQPVADFVPEWKGTPKAAITVGHLLANTSGLADKRTTEDIYASGDFVKLAIDAQLKTPPGKAFFYSNLGANLLPHVAKIAGGASIDELAKKRLFKPLGLSDVRWDLDKAGNVQGMAGLQMSTRDLAAIGQLVVDRGRHCDAQLLPEAWLRDLTAPRTGNAKPQRFLWWLTPESNRLGFSANLFESWQASGVPADFIDKFRPLENKYFEGKDFFAAVNKALNGVDGPPANDDAMALWYETTWKAGRPDGEREPGPLRAIRADGYGGQVLLVYPSKGVVVARLRDLGGGTEAKEPTNVPQAIDDIIAGKEPSSAQAAIAPEPSASPAVYPGEKTVADWLMTGVGAPDFELGADAGAVRIAPKGAPSKRFVALLRALPAESLVGKQVTASMLVRAADLEKPGACVLKIQKDRPLAYQGLLATSLSEVAESTKGFVRCTVSAKVPDGARWILFGVSYRGRGTMWVKSPELRESSGG